MRSSPQNKERSIFEGWLADHQGLLFRVVRAYAVDPHDQDDLFQEVCSQLWRSVSRFQGNSAETTWVYRVSLYTAMRWSKRERRSKTDSLGGYEPVLKPVDEEDSRLAWLYEQIHKLNKIDRSVTLMMLDGIAYQHIAETLGISESNVGVKVHRIKQRLTKAAEEGGLK